MIASLIKIVVNWRKKTKKKKKIRKNLQNTSIEVKREGEGDLLESFISDSMEYFTSREQIK